MPKKKKEPFIDPDNATTYRLVPGYVPDDPYEEKLNETEEEVEKRKIEQRESGVFFEDDYNYMRHLRSLKEVAMMVKVSDLEDMEDEMMSSIGGSHMGRPASSYGPTPSAFGPSGSSVNFRMFSSKEKRKERIDPDILQSFDEATKVKVTEDGEMDCGDVNILDDDFIDKAGGYKPKPKRADDDDLAIDRGFAIDDEQDLGSDFDDFDFDVEDNDFDDRTDHPEGRGTVQDDIIEAQTALILKNFQEGLGFSHVAQDIDDDDCKATAEDYEYLKEILRQEKRKQEKIVTADQFLDNHADRPDFDYAKYEKSDDDEEEFEWKEVAPSKPKFDCISILSLNSNTRNLPTDIIPPSSEKRRTKNSSVSEADPSDRGLSRRELDEEMRLSRRADKASTFKPKDETPEEKRGRKKAVKDERKERRQEKKANRIVFSMERQKLAKETAASSKAGKGIKLI